VKQRESNNYSQTETETLETEIVSREQVNQLTTPKECPGLSNSEEDIKLQQSQSDRKQITNQETSPTSILPVPSLIQDQNTCTNCGGRGHSANVCPTGRTSSEMETLDNHLDEYYDDDLPDTYDQEDFYDDFNDDGRENEQAFDDDLMDENVEDYSYGDFDDYD